jgi:hypothetical protein
MVRIVVDAMGSDNFPKPDVEGAVMAAREYGVEIILVGDEAVIKPVLLDAQNAGSLHIRIIHAPEMLTMEDKGEKLVLKARSKEAKNSMAVGIDLVKNGEADAFVSMGNTGAGMVNALFRWVASAAWTVLRWLRSSPPQQGLALCLTLAQTLIASQRISCNLAFWEVFMLKKYAAYIIPK